jgi:hypothetical protein
MTKRYTCWNCGKDMGAWDSRYCSSRDVCGDTECNRAAQDAAREEREEAHRDLDERMGW